MREYGAQAVVWQTAMNPVVALELLATGVWSGAGVLGPEAFASEPFLDLLKDGYGQEWEIEERDPVTHAPLRPLKRRATRPGPCAGSGPRRARARAC